MDNIDIATADLTNPCGCEHINHDSIGFHDYLAVPAGSRVAAYVGAICDACADGCLSQYVVK